MVHIIIWAIMFGIWYLYRTYKASVEEDEYYRSLEYNTDNENRTEEVMNVEKCLDNRTITGLVLSTLRKIGCEPETDQRATSNFSTFTYQGEKFTIESNDECFFITIYDTWWYSMSVYSDVEDISRLHKTINMVNQYANCTLLYITNKEIEEIGVHSRRTILFVKEIKDLDQYLISVLNDFFRAQRMVLTQLDRCKVAEEKS